MLCQKNCEGWLVGVWDVAYPGKLLGAAEQHVLLPHVGPERLSLCLVRPLGLASWLPANLVEPDSLHQDDLPAGGKLLVVALWGQIGGHWRTVTQVEALLDAGQDPGDQSPFEGAGGP